MEPVFQPTSFSHVSVVQLDTHILGRLPRTAEAEVGLPDAIIAKFEKVDLSDGRKHQRPRPAVLIKIEQRSLGMSELGEFADRWHAVGEFGFMINDKNGA